MRRLQAGAPLNRLKLLNDVSPEIIRVAVVSTKTEPHHRMFLLPVPAVVDMQSAE